MLPFYHIKLAIAVINVVTIRITVYNKPRNCIAEIEIPVKLRTLSIALIATVLLLLSVAGGSLYWILAQSPLPFLQGGVNREPTAAIFVPKQAPVMVSLLANPERLEAFSQLIAAPQNRRQSRQELQEVEKSLLANTGLDYQQEIRPWLGDEITLAVTSLDFDRNFNNGTQPGYLLAVNTKDAQLAKEFLQLSYSRQALAGTSDLVFEQYQGVNLIFRRSRQSQLNTSFVASGIVGDFVLFANHPKVLRDAINNVQVRDLNLRHSPAYREALDTILTPRIGIAYANLPALSAWIANLPTPETPEASQMLALALSLKSRGLVAQTALIGVSGQENQPPALSQPPGSLAYIPSHSILTAAGTNLQQFWQQIATGLAPDSPLQQILNRAIVRLQTPLGIDLPQDIFTWVRGEYSLAAIPPADGGEPDWIFVAEKTAGTDVDSAIAHLDELAKEGGYSVGNLPLLDRTVTAWTKLVTATSQQDRTLARLEAQVRGVHLAVDKYVIFTTSIEAMSQAISGAKLSLLASEKFRQAISALPLENDGYFYVDWQQSEPIIEEKLPVFRVVEFAIKPLFNNLRSFTVSSQGSEGEIRHATAFLNLGVR